MQSPFFPAEAFDPGRGHNNPRNLTQDMLPQQVVQSSAYGDASRAFVSTGVTMSKAPQQRVLMLSPNYPGHPSRVLPRQVIEQLGAIGGSSLPMGSQGLGPRGMDTSLSGARRRAGRG